MPPRSFANFQLIMSRHGNELRRALDRGLFDLCVIPSRTEWVRLCCQYVLRVVILKFKILQNRTVYL